ncbi:phosphoribosyltransferase family protein [Nonomuraea sp. NPDC048916]|uniref:ComF family protein n=1 Tax=Nonomuraea sp. NPDC048916 TaxID=3154232 RepID=UPI0033CE1A45
MLSALLDLVLPQPCVGCGATGASLCDRCLAGLFAAPARRPPSPRPPGLPDCWSAADYSGPVRQAIVAYKERARMTLAGPLAEALAFTVASARPGADGFALVPVPSARRALRARGHDPVGRLAALAARHLRRLGHGAEVRDVLTPGRRVADQAGLSAGCRAANLAGSLRAVTPVEGPVVLVDDLVTTGSTLAEAARAVRAGGAEVLFAATVAATRRRSCKPLR